jgi:transcription elongation GreA/GreB family factor
MDKSFLVEQLDAKIRQAVVQRERTAQDAREEARTHAARTVNLARGQIKRHEDACAALEELERFTPRPLRRGEPIGVGAVVEVESDEVGRTLFLAPVGAGEELTGPDGDGIFQVVTPASPFGRALLGKRVNDVVEVTIHGELTEWTISFVA